MNLPGSWTNGAQQIVSQPWQQFFEETRVPAAVLANGVLRLSGHCGEIAYETFSEDPEAQVRQTFVNVGATLESAGCDWSDVVEITSYHVGLQRHAGMVMAVASEFLSDPYPAWTAVGVTELFDLGAIFELSCVAVVRPADTGATTRGPVGTP